MGLSPINAINSSNFNEIKLMDNEHTSLEKDNPQYHAQDVNSGITTTAYYWEEMNLPEGIAANLVTDLDVHPNEELLSR